MTSRPDQLATVRLSFAVAPQRSQQKRGLTCLLSVCLPRPASVNLALRRPSRVVAGGLTPSVSTSIRSFSSDGDR